MPLRRLVAFSVTVMGVALSMAVLPLAGLRSSQLGRGEKERARLGWTRAWL